MPHNCPECGVSLAWATRACPRCGERLPDPYGDLLDPARLDDPTRAVPTGVSAAAELPPLGLDPTEAVAGVPVRPRRLGPRGWWSQSRHRALVAITLCGIVLGAAVALAFTVGNPGVDTNRVVPAAATGRRHLGRRVPVPTPTTAASADDQREVAYLNQLESVLQWASPGRAVLVSSLQGAPGSCALPPTTAAALVAAVVQNRTNLLNALGALPPAPDPEAQQLEQLLAAALHASAQADGAYEAWLNANQVANPTSCSASASPGVAVFWNSARASDSTATTAKTAFVTAFDPVAARYGLATWTEAQF